MLPPEQLKANRLLWTCIAGVIFLELMVIQHLGLTVNAPYAKGVFIIIAVSLLISLFYRYMRRDDGLSIFAGALSQLICGSFAISIGTYIAAYMSHPIADPFLITVDSNIGFHWWNYAHWVDSYTWLAPLLARAYGSCNMQLAILLPLLFYHRSAHGQRVFVTLFIAGMITAIISTFFPVEGAYVYYNIGADSFQHFTPSGPTAHQEQLFALLHHTTNNFTYPGDGVVGFPSYHSVIAVTLMYAALPYPYVFKASIVLNCAVLLSTPIAGAHYLSDVLAGIAVALIAIIIAQRILPSSKIYKIQRPS